MIRNIAIALAGLAAQSGSATAQTIDPFYNCAYIFADLGAPPGVPTPLGGLVVQAEDPNFLLVGGSANGNFAAIYKVPIVRNGDNEIVGFAGQAELFATAPNIDGGLFYAPGDVLLFTRYPVNGIGQVLPGSAEPDKYIDLNQLGFTGSVGASTIVPAGFPGAGRLKVFPFQSSVWHDAMLTPDGNGTFDISGPANSIQLQGGPEGIVYVEAGASLFPVAGVLISEYSAGAISAYEVDANGDPVPGTRRVFMTGLGGAEGGTRDPITGDFLFSTFGGGNRVIAVRGFTPDCDVRANLNRDCLLDFFDVQMFLQAFATQQPAGDFNDDGSFDFFDAQAFLANFATGCN
jgi:hypothetical protein